MAYVSRSAWGARKPSVVYAQAWREVRGLAVHHEGAPAPKAHEDCAKQVRSVQRFHMESRGYSDIAYSFIVCPHGSILVGRGWEARCGANGDNTLNRRYLAVCVLGLSPKPTRRVEAALQLVRRDLLGRKAAAVEVVPHSALRPTACPGDPLRAWIRAKGYETPAGEEDDVAQFSDEQARFLRVLADALVKKKMAGYRPVDAVEELAEHLANHPAGAGGSHSHTATVQLD